MVRRMYIIYTCSMYIMYIEIFSHIQSKSRDPERSPMQWTPDSAECSGFTTNCTQAWLPVHPNANITNVEVTTVIS